MLKDLFRRKEIDNNALLIAVKIMASYHLEGDRQCGTEKRVRGKTDEKLINAISKGSALIV